MNKKDLTEDDAKRLLKELSKFYGEPVLPMRKFCNGITTWFRCIENIPTSNTHGRVQGQEYKKHLRTIERDILKSNLLGRIFYGGEELRTTACPKHKGTWSGLGDCPYGCQLTGWLPNDEKDRENSSWMLAEIRWTNGIKSVVLRPEVVVDSVGWDDSNTIHKLKVRTRDKRSSTHNYYIVKFLNPGTEELFASVKEFTLISNNIEIAKGKIV